MIAVVAMCLASGLLPETAVELANLAAGIVVAKVGTVPVEKHELLAALSPQMALDAEGRVLTREELVNAWPYGKPIASELSLPTAASICFTLATSRCSNKPVDAETGSLSRSIAMLGELPQGTHSPDRQPTRTRSSSGCACSGRCSRNFREPTPLELISQFSPTFC